MARVHAGTLTVLVFAVLVGLGGAYIVRQQMRQGPVSLVPPAAGPSDIVVPVAAVDLEPGQLVTINDIAMVRMSPAQFGKSKYAGIPYMRSSGQIQDRMLKAGVKRGDAFLTTFFYPDGAGPGIAEMLEEGYRAVTIPIHDVGAVAGFARPGSFVDVLFRSEETDDRPEVTVTLLERVQVLSVNRVIRQDSNIELDQQGRVTLAVTPMQAKVLKVVENRGELSLALRNPKDELDSMPIDRRLPARGEAAVDGLRAMAQAVRDNQAVGPSGLMPVQIMTTDNPRGAWNYGTERVLAGTDQISLDDLLGTPPKPKVVQMEVYRGGSKEVLSFNAPAAPANAPRLINRPLISTPLVGPQPDRPRVYARQMETVQADEPALPAAGG